MDTSRRNMQPNEFERLFLMEFMINKIHYSNSSMKLDPNFLSTLGKTTVLINFKDIPLLEISEDDFIPKEEPFEDTEITFKNGKSCLFALRDNQITFQTCSSALITVQRKLPEGEEKEYFVIGEATADLSGSFMNVLSGCGAPCKCVCNTFNIKNGREETVGTISLMIRLTNYGKMIMTQFQLAGGEGSSFLFKGVSESGLPPGFKESSKPAVITPGYGMGNQYGDFSYGGMPGAGMPGMGMPGAGMPGAGMPGTGMPGAGMPGVGMPGTGMPGAGMPGAGMPGAGMPGTGMPGMGMPGAGMPGAGMPGYSTPWPPAPYGAMPGTFPGSMPGGMNGAGPGFGFPQGQANPSFAPSVPMFPGSSGVPGIISQQGSRPIMSAAQLPNSIEDDSCDPRYKELTAEVNGYSLKIRLLRRPKK